ncbi:hypothetical protein TNCV_1551811 [Trichonephila clavipes]|nr:hypothetical protein TNCV_1551811 [Trichonephila clavipes]
MGDSSITFLEESPIPTLKTTYGNRRRRKNFPIELTNAGISSTKKRVSNDGHRESVEVKCRAIANDKQKEHLLHLPCSY